ncbi:MAG: hypothetical protein R2757_11335 [Draconibacterium sp.]|jgi:hypothetical protein
MSLTIKLLFIFSFIVPLISCTEEKTTKTDICVLIDVTDERFKDNNFVQENLPKILALMNLDKDKGGYSGGEVKLSLINEVSDSKSKTVKIEAAETGLMGENPLNRKDQVQKFYANLENAFSKVLEHANWGTDASKIYQKVARELIKMKSSDGDKKYLIIYSDMLENSQLFSFYGTNWKNNVNKLIENPEATLKTLSEEGPALPDLSEFIIYIITTRTAENDEKINLSEQLWMALLEYQGATVYFNSGLEI